MPLTAAERCRKYREKLKETNPQKFEEMKKRNADRTKSKKRKIEDMNEDEKEEVRKQWRNAKRKKVKPREEEPMTVGEERSRRRYRSKQERENRKLKEQHKRLRLEYQNFRKISTRKIRILTEQLNNLKSEKRTVDQGIIAQGSNELTPLTKSNIFIEKELPHVSEEAKQKVKQKLLQHHVLEESLKKTYKESIPYEERKILKKLVQSEPVKKYKMQEKLTKCLGLKSGIRRYQTIKQRRLKTVKEIRQFYERDDVSRMTAGKKECLTLKKNKKQKRFLLNTLLNLYKLYRNEGGSLSFSTFKRYRPFYIVPPNISDRKTCVCVKHANLTFKAESLKKLGLIATTDLSNLVSEIACDVKSKICMYSECRECSEKRLSINITGECPEDVSWFEWTTKTHEFEKSGERKVTKRTVKENRTGSVTTLTKLMQNDLIKFKEHHFNIYHQHKQYKTAIEQIQDYEAIIHCDFSENYACKMAEEVQAMHFGASKRQITLHTGVAYIKNESPLSFCTISPSLKHNPEAIWGHLEPVLMYLKEKHPTIDRIHFYSDGPTTQYRQKKKFLLFSEKTKEAGFVQATWSFFEASHGKGAADGVGGAIKRILDKRVTYGDDIVDAKSAFAALAKTETTVKTFYVTEESIEAIKISSEERIQVIPSTMKLHQIIATEDKNIIKYRQLSCFCARGNCDCFSTKLHVLKTTKQRKTKGKKSNEEQKRTRKRTKKMDSHSDSENTDTEVMYAESDNDIDWNEDESFVSTDEEKENEQSTANETEKASKICNVVKVQKKHEKVKIISEIRNTPDNLDHFNLKKIRLTSLKSIGMDFVVCSKKSETKNDDIYANPVPSTSRIPTMTMSETLNLHDEDININSNDNRNEYMEGRIETCRDYVKELNQTEKQENTTGEKEQGLELGSLSDEHSEKETEEQKRTTGGRGIDVNLKDDFDIDKLKLLPDEYIMREKEEQERTTGEKETGLDVEDCLNKNKQTGRETEELESKREGEIGDKLEDCVSKNVVGSASHENLVFFLVNDSVLVRYYQRKHWKYFIGIIKNIEIKNSETLYTISFFKTIKKPVLKFKVPKRVDVDVVTRFSILKKVQVYQHLNEFYLSDNASDEIYF